ncbi:MAG TPA: hypothetical protein VJ788_09365, partial [Gemmatimonadota bacterium]|nr:hypothetical protein [Gemmatimonadota bacterium]
LRGRLDRAFEVRPECKHLPRPPSAYLKRFTYDTISYNEDVLRDLVEGPFTGIPNVENAADTSFEFLFYRFTAALLLDGEGLASDPFFDIPSLDLRQRFQSAKQFWAGTSPPRLPGSFLGVRASTVPGSLSAAGVTLSGGSPAYFEVSATGPGTHPVVVRADRQSNLQVTIIRTR